MAVYAPDIPEPCHRVEYHFSKVLGGEQNDVMLEWLNDPEQAGEYAASLGGDCMTMSFLFSSVITAFEFKLKFC